MRMGVENLHSSMFGPRLENWGNMSSSHHFQNIYGYRLIFMGNSFDFKSPLARNLAKHNNQDQSFEKTPLKTPHVSKITTVADKTPHKYIITHTRPTYNLRRTSTVAQTSSSSFAHKLRQRREQQEQGQPSPATPTSSASPSSPAQEQRQPTPTASASTAPPTTSIDDLQHQFQTGIALNDDDGEEVQSHTATATFPHYANLDRRSTSKSPSVYLTTPNNSTFINSAPVKAIGPGLLQVTKPTTNSSGSGGGGISKHLETSVVEKLPKGITTIATAAATRQQERQSSQKTPPPPQQQQQPSTIQHNLLMSLPSSIALPIDPNVVLIENISTKASINTLEEHKRGTNIMKTIPPIMQKRGNAKDLLQQLHKLKMQGDDLIEEEVSEEFSRVLPPSPLSRGNNIRDDRVKSSSKIIIAASTMSGRAMDTFNRLKKLQYEGSLLAGHQPAM